MKSGRCSFPIFHLLMAVACGALFASPILSHAQRPQPVSEIKSLHEWANSWPIFYGTGIQPMAATGGAIASPIFFPSNSVSVDLVALLRSGSTHGTINVSVTGYMAGAYTVSAVTVSSSSTVVLGTLTVTSGSLSIPLGGAGNPIVFNNVRATPSDIALPIWNFSTGHAKFGGAVSPFPAGFSPFNVASLSLSDSNGNVVSTVVLTPVQNGYLNAVSPLVAGTFAPGATGYALIHADTPPRFLPMALTASATKSALIPVDPVPLPPVFFHPTTGHLAIHAQGLPASTTLTYAADGTDLGTATTDASGNLTVYAAQGYRRKLPSTLDLFSVSALTVHDASGNVLVSASF